MMWVACGVVCVLSISIFDELSPKEYSIHHLVIQFVSDLKQVGGVLRALPLPPPDKSCPDKTTMLLGGSPRYNMYKVVMMDWLIVTK